MTETSAPTLSVVMSVYNGGRYLKRAADSVLEQTFQDFEFVIVNDGSTDDTKEIIASYSDPRIRVLDQPNRGIIASLNRGVREARADIVARMDADDISYPDRFEIQYSFLAANPDVVVVGSRCELMDERDATIALWSTPIDDVHIRREMFFRNPMFHGSMMLRKTAFERAGGYRAVIGAEDFDLLSRLAALGKMANIPTNLYRWRENPDGLSNRQGDEQRRSAARLIDSFWRELTFPRLSVRQIVSEGKRYRGTLRRSDYARYVMDQYILAVALLRRRRAMQGLMNLWAAMRLDPTRLHYLGKAFSELRRASVR